MSSSFREKEIKLKKSKIKHNTNLLLIHNEKIKKFDNDYNSLGNLEITLSNLMFTIKKLEINNTKTLGELKELVELKEKFAEVQNQLENIKSHTNMMDYYFYTSDLIDSYYTLENEPNKSKINISNFFKPSEDEKRLSKKDLLEQYLDCTEEKYEKIQIEQIFNFCRDCKKEMIVHKQHGIFICTSCGKTIDIAIDSETNKNPSVTVSENPKYSVYQRKNHFKEWLNQIQAKESTDVPDEVFDLIKIELNKLRFYNLAELEPEIIRKILKKLNLTKYYENSFHIIFRLNNIQPPTLSRDLEEKLLFYFKQIEEPFKIYKNKNRKNILRYSYILYKLCELLELDDFLPCFKLLKNRNKLKEQDVIWECICKHLEWQFIPSI